MARIPLVDPDDPDAPRGQSNTYLSVYLGARSTLLGATLDGRPIGSLRLSSGDGRARHRGVSDHSLTAYGRVALLPADLVVPATFDDAGALSALAGRHRLVRVPVDGLDQALRASPVKLSTMGRGLDDDHVYFLAAAAAGRHAASLLSR